MANKTLDVLKSYFYERAYPTWQQFHDVLESFRHKSDKISITDVDGLTNQLNGKASTEQLSGYRKTSDEISISDVTGLENALANAGGGGTGASSVITSDIPVNLSGGRTFGKYASGSTIPATGKTVEEVIRMAALEAINPTATLVITSGVPEYNSANITNVLSFSYTLRTPGATIVTALLQFRRNNTGNWMTIGSLTTTPRILSHVVSDLTGSDRVDPFNYQYVVTDSNGSTVTVTADVTPAAYAAPTCSIVVSGTRERGNVSTSLIGTVSQLAQNGVSITSRTLQYSLNNSTWVDIAAGTLTNTINYTHNDSALINATIIYYRIVVVCSTPSGNQTATLTLGSVSFVYKSVFGYDASATPSLATVLAMGNSALTNTKAKTVTATAPAGNYTYYAYCATAGDIAGIIMDGVTPVLGSFTKMTDVTGVNSYGASVTYRIYKSNAPAAFTSNSLVIS